MKRFGFYFVFNIVFWLVNTQAEREITFDRLTVTDGLSSNNVSSVCQDQYGFLWIATFDGLNRFDGYEFQVYKHQPGDSTSLPSNEVNLVYMDRQGVLWVGSLAGLSRWDRNSDNFKNYEPIPTRTGAAEQSVILITEDSQNRLWIGTRWNGLFIFNRDKETFEQMKINNGQSVQPLALAIRDIIETASGKIYTSSFHEGLMEYHEKENIFKPTKLNPKINSLFIRNLIFSFHEDKEGILWFGTIYKGLYTYDVESNMVTAIDLSDKLKPTKELWIYDLFEDDQGFLWIASSNGIYRYNLKTKTYEHYLYDAKNQRSISENDVRIIFYDKYGMLWFGTFGGGLCKYDQKKIPFQKFAIFSESAGSSGNLAVLSLAVTPEDRDVLWLGTQNGLVRYNRKNDTYKFINEVPSLGINLEDDAINDLYYAGDGDLWLATDSTGLLKYNISNGQFVHYNLEVPTINSVAGDRILFIEPDDYGKLWIGTRGGLYRFDPQSGIWSLIPGMENRTYDQELMKFVRKIADSKQHLSSILQVGDNEDLVEEFILKNPADVLVISVGEGALNWNMVDYGWLENEKGDTLMSAAEMMNSFNLNGDRKNRITLGIVKLPAGKYKLRYVSDESHCYGNYNVVPPEDSLWWGIQAFIIADSEARKYDSILQNDLSSTYLLDSYVRVIESGSNGNIWVGTSRGFSKFELQSRKITNYGHNKENAETLSNDIVTDIQEDADGIVWLTTESGLNRFDPANESFTSYFEKDGLPSAQLMALESDADGNIWISSINGLSKLEKSSEEHESIFINYDIKEGLQGYIFNRNCSFIGADGELFFGGRNGANAFFPGKINNQPADIVIPGFYISNQMISPVSENSPLQDHILNTRKITLDYDHNDISFAIATLHFSRPERNKLAHKLEGFDDNWIQNNRRFVSFTNLNPGQYKLRIRGTNSDGIKSPQERVIDITILPPWWQTTWAYILYVFVFAGVVFTIDRIQRYRLTQRERSRAQIREAELRAQAAEAQAKLIEAENKRKTQELEEARKLQLSMLPKQLPQLPHLNIAVYMQTATEVGGDYYDFHVSLDGTLTVVIGDATGHGMKAGTMVTTAKSLFNSYAPNPDILYSFREITRCIRQMNLDKLSMCMSMLKIRDNSLLMSAAGMPPILLFRRQDRTIEEHLIQGMPLGAMEKYPYEIKETTLAPGDTIMLMSDGFAELQNGNNQLYGYKRVRNAFEEVADKEPEEIITHLKSEGSIWTDGKKPDDDITFVIIKVENYN